MNRTWILGREQEDIRRELERKKKSLETEGGAPRGTETYDDGGFPGQKDILYYKGYFIF
jgi:hypothetical protein